MVDSIWRLETTDGIYYLSDNRQVTRVVGIGVNMHNRVFRKYTMPGFVEVTQGDTVVDVGAFIGEFARAAGERASHVIAIEPDERNATALRHNLAHLGRSSVIQKAAWRETGERTFHVAGDPSEGSILGVDSNDELEQITLETICIEEVPDVADVDAIDFLKVEAEGVEPEVLEGVGDLKIPKIAVECAPERNGKTPEPAIRSWLNERGYTVRSDGHILFGRL